MGRHALTTLVLAALAGLARAQEKPPGDGAKKPAQAEKLPEGFVDIQAGNAVSWQEGELTVTFLTGGVTIKRTGLEMTADRALSWRKKGSGESFEELYAEGKVVLKREKQQIHCERLYLDFHDADHPKAVIIDFRGESVSREFRMGFYVRAREMRMVTKGEFEATDVSLTTCSFGVPHYHLSVARARLVGREEHPKKDAWDFFPYDDWSIELEEIYPELVGAPIFFIPALVLSPLLKDLPLRQFHYGHSSRFGHTVYTEWGMKIRKTDEGGKLRVWGDVGVEMDWRQTRGFAVGPKLEYKWDGYQGYLDTYYLHDRERDPDLGFNSKFGPLEHHDRGRAHLFHRQDLDGNWRFELEANYLSDRDLLEEFFLREFQEFKDPETAAYLRWIDGPLGGFLYERHRLNDFQTQNEYLPRLSFSAFQLPVLRPAFADLYLNERFDAGRIRRRFDDATDIPSEDVWRIDSVTELALPVDFGPFQVSPFAQERLTYYEYDLEGDTELRSLASAGVGITTQIHGTFPDIAWEWIGLRGVRHIMEVEARIAGTLNHSVAASELFPFDEVDPLGPMEEVLLEFRQRFKTRDSSGKSFEFLNLGVAVEYYPRPDRDTVFANVSNHQPPFNYILVVPDAAGNFPSRKWSNVYYDGAFTPRNFLSASGYGEYNPISQREEFRQYGITVTPMENVRLSVGQTYVPGITNAFTASALATLSPKWSVRADAQYDFHLGRYLTQSIVVSRDYHDFIVEAVAEHDFNREDRRVFVAFVPKFLGDKGMHRSRIYGPAGLPPPAMTSP